MKETKKQPKYVDICFTKEKWEKILTEKYPNLKTELIRPMAYTHRQIQETLWYLKQIELENARQKGVKI